MKKQLILFVLVASFYLSLTSARAEPTATIQIGLALVQVNIADTWETIRKGLGGREKLPANQGMLFIFQKAKRYPFYMKGMQFALDIVWLYQNKVVGITTAIQPPEHEKSTLPLYYPPTAVDMVLEITSGHAKRLGITKGNTLSFLTSDTGTYKE